MGLILNMLQLRLRLIFRNKATLLLSVFTMIIFASLIGGLYENEKESTQIPIAYVDDDQTAFSKEFIGNIRRNELLRATEVKLEQGIRWIKEGKIQVLFVVHQGAMEQINDGDLEGLMDIYYIAENYVPPLIGDVVVGEMLEEVCIISAVNYLEDAMGANANKEVLQEAYSYGQQLASERKKDYYVHIEYVQLTTGVAFASEQINQSIIFKQMILGIMLSFIAFYALFSAIHIVKDVELGLSEKIRISKTNRFIMGIGNYLSILVSTSLIAFLSAGLNAVYSEKFWLTLFSNWFIFSLYIIVISAITLLLAQLFQNISSFVVVGSALILTMGIVSGCFFSIDLAIPSIKQFASLTPSYHALKQLLSVVVQGELSGLGPFVRYGVVAFLVLVGMNTLLEWKKYRW